MRSTNKILGDITAENDTAMLDVAFFQTPEFATITGSNTGSVVVGRRGTGKSAIFARMKKEFLGKKTTIIELAPDEEHIIPIRKCIESLSASNYRLVKAIVKIIFKACLYSVMLDAILKHYKAKGIESYSAAEKWMAENEFTGGGDLLARFCMAANKIARIDKSMEPERALGLISDKYDLRSIQRHINCLLEQCGNHFEVLIDRIDEGYESDDIGIGIIGGITTGLVEFNHTCKNSRGTIFVRDNIFRKFQSIDDDFTKNIEGQEIRLNWNEATLYQLVSTRIKALGNVTGENDWNSFIAGDLRGKDGFRECLRHTLYRPRDILSLLNKAAVEANRRGIEKIDLACIRECAKEISLIRFSDLIREYTNIIPNLELILKSFRSCPAVLSKDELLRVFASIVERKDDPLTQRLLDIHTDIDGFIKLLYSIGFIGVFDDKQNVYIFCHDGKSKVKSIDNNGKALIHPCYWISLDLVNDQIDDPETLNKNIDDEYTVIVHEYAPDQRARHIMQLSSKLETIVPGREQAGEFHDWAFDALKIALLGPFKNPEKHPNGSAVDRRDIVFTVTANSDFSDRILRDYNCRQLTIEIKNYTPLTNDDYRQVNSYLNNTYGSFGIIIDRGEDDNLSGLTLGWTREMYCENKKVILRIPARILAKYLRKTKNVQQQNAFIEYLDKTLDKYVRFYLTTKHQS